MYKVSDSNFISLPETPKVLSVNFILDFNGTIIPFSKDVVYKYNDPVKGEVYKPFEILPEVSASFNENVYIFADDNFQKISIKVKSVKDGLQGEVSLNVPENWNVSPINHQFNLEQKGALKPKLPAPSIVATTEPIPVFNATRPIGVVVVFPNT